MKENSIEETNLENFKLLILDCKEHRKLYNESFVSEDDIEIMDNILFDHKRVLKENELAKEVLKKQCDIADERNQLLKENEELKAENNKLKVIKYDTNYGTETINLIPKSELVKINTNRYMIEIENGKFVDLKQVYQENEELKEKWDKDTYKLQNDLDIANAKIIELKKEKDAIYLDYQDLGKEKWKSDETILFLTERLENYIPTQKIKDKIEELKSYKGLVIYERCNYESQIKTLQDLLEEKGEK